MSLEALDAVHAGANAQAEADPLAAALKSRTDGGGAITAVFLGLRSRGAALGVQRAVNEYAAEPLTAILPGATLQEVWEITGVVERTLFAVSAMVVVVGLAGMLVALLTSLTERRREMAILRSVGARPAHVFAMILGEAALLTLLGIALGVLALYAGLLVAQDCTRGALRTLRCSSMALDPRTATAAARGRGRCAHRPVAGLAHLPLLAGRRHDHSPLRHRHMKPIVRPAAACSAFLLALPVSVHAQTPKQIQWQDLAPKVASRRRSVREALARPAAHALRRRRHARTQEPRATRRSRPTTSRANRRERNDCSRKASTWTVCSSNARNSRNSARLQGDTLNAVLDGQTVRLPGYVLPLEITGKKVTEFLLVPWVGACIHTPPPPPNQIVHVKADAPFEVTSLFAPVWVTGRLTAGATKRELTLLDGSSDIDVGYTVRASRIEPFKE